MRRIVAGIFLATCGCLATVVEAAEEVPVPAEAPTAKPSNELRAALERLKLPGVKINLDERCVDVEGKVCLTEGMLELIACTVDSKEHESIIAVAAKPSHIHAALLLLGATAGNPAMRRPINEEGTRFIDIPPRGEMVDAFLVFGEDGRERPISEFIVPSEEAAASSGVEDETAGGGFPTHTFLFAGSLLDGDGKAAPRYLADRSGHVITLSTFGDELLAMQGVHSQDAGALIWAANGETLPALDTKVLLRLRPHGKPGAADADAK